MELNPYECAIMIVRLAQKKGRAKKRKISRFQLSILSIKKIVCRNVITPLFIESLKTELTELGWCMFQVENTRYAFIRLSTVNSWLKYSSTTIEEDVLDFLEIKRSLTKDNPYDVFINRMIELENKGNIDD